MSRSPVHTSLERLDTPGEVWTAGRLTRRHGTWHVCNAAASVPLVFEDEQDGERLVARDLVQIRARWTGEHLQVLELRVHAVQRHDEPDALEHVSWHVVTRRARCVTIMRKFFEERDFLEVRTPGLVDEPGTDVYIEPFGAPFIPEEEIERASPSQIGAYLHTSPELLMKRLLGKGFERIWQMTPAWRNGEVTDRHAPEFTCVEWYRAWEGLNAIMEDTEALIGRLIGAQATWYDDTGARRLVALGEGFKRLTMQELVQEACGFDLLAMSEAGAFEEAVYSRGLLRRRKAGRGTNQMFGAGRLGEEPEQKGDEERWMELFFELQVTHLDPHLEQLGAVSLTRWPAQLAVLAAPCEDDPRVAERFETYIGGVECCNGFGELTDVREQRRRFEEDLAQRARLGRPPYPMPEKFLRAMAMGMPPSAGVAMGFDRVVMLATGSRTISEVLPFGMRRGAHARAPEFG